MIGFGTYHYKNGNVYNGMLLNGRRHGEGELAYQDGVVYNGNWVMGKRNGISQCILELLILMWVKEIYNNVQTQ